MSSSAFLQARNMLADLLKDKPRLVWVTGHSLGAALASLFVAVLVIEHDEILNYFGGLYSFGQPRIGDRKLGSLFLNLESQGKVYRVVNDYDIVPHLPPKKWFPDYIHHGTLVFMSSDGRISYQDHLSPHEEKNPKLRNLTDGAGNNVRKFVKGLVSNEESGLRRFVRVVFPPCANDHYPSDYVRGLGQYLKLREEQFVRKVLM